MGLYADITPPARAAGLRLTHVDEMLCNRIDAVNKRIGEGRSLPFKGMNVSFESEFLVPPKTLSIWSKKRSQCLPADQFLAAVSADEYAAIGCKIVTDAGMAQKLEANTLPRPDGGFPTQPECVREYFKFRAKAKKDVAAHFPESRYQRYSEHVHFSFKDANGRAVENLDPRFIKLLEASLAVHWQVARPLVTAVGALIDANPPRYSSHAYINSIGTRPEVNDRSLDEVGDFTSFIVRREEPRKHHYEIRRTLPGPDAVVRGLPFNPMLVTQGLLAASVNVAMAAYSNPALESTLLAEARKVEEKPNAYGQDVNALIREISQNPILNHPDSIGQDIGLALAQEMSSHINDNAGYREMIADARRQQRGNRRG